MNQPRVTVGMVVRNGERYIAHAIESFLAQTFRDFTLVVHDNASTDQTLSIAENIARRDRRVRIVHNPHDVGVVRNLIDAAEAAESPLFCWAACDDLRERRFLERLVALLDANPDASLACCAVRNIDPDGTPRDIRAETALLRTSTGMTASQRLHTYLKEMPGTPFYGLFHTADLKCSLDILREIDSHAGGGPPLLGLDMVFLARFVRDFGIAYESEPLLAFRRGGISHNIGRFGTLGQYLRHLRRFNAVMRRATAIREPLISRMCLSLARRAAMLHWLCSREMRRMTTHYVLAALPGMRAVQSRAAVVLDPALRRLRDRLALQPMGCRVILFGAGKHTRRRLPELRATIGDHAVLIAACDHLADQCEPIPGLAIEPVARLSALQPDIVLVSSDTYESAMYRRAIAVAPRDAVVWRLYDPANEHVAGIGECESTSATNAAISSIESPVAATR